MNKSLYALWMTLLCLLLAVGVIAIIWGMREHFTQFSLSGGDSTAIFTHFHCISSQNMG